MRINPLEAITSIVIQETSYGYRLVGYKESILPLARLARIKYKKKLKSKRLVKKYAKKLLKDAIQSFLRDRLYDE